MSLSSLITKNPFTGDGATTTFNFTFPIVDANDVIVYVDGAILLPTQYSVQPQPDLVGGSVTLLVAPAVNSLGLIKRLMVIDQPEHLEENATLPSATLEQMSDRSIMIAQQQQEQIDRSLQLSPTDTSGASLVIPPLVPSQCLAVNSDGTGFELVPKLTSSGSGTGDVLGLNGSTKNSLAFFSDTTGIQLGQIVPGTAGQVLTSNGPNSPASMQAAPAGGTINGLFRPNNIQASARGIPASGALSGTYHHNGAFSSGGVYTFAHGTRLYVNGNFTVNVGHTFTGTPQSNGAIANGAANAGQNGGGLGGGQGGAYPKGGGSGAGGMTAGGAGGQTLKTIVIAGGRAYTTRGMGGSGGGSGAGSGKLVGAPGGGGGPFLLIEVNGNVVLNESLFLDGAAGSDSSAALGGAGAGGSGGQIVIRATGTITIGAGKSIFLRGGAGGNGNGTTVANSTGLRAGGGAGGYAELTAGGAITINGAITATGGAKGAGSLTPLSDAAAGTAGTFDVYANTTPISF